MATEGTPGGPATHAAARVLYVTMLCEPGSREDRVCAEATAGGVDDPTWFQMQAGGAAVVTVTAVRICRGEALPEDPSADFDAVVIGGTFNSAVDDVEWLARLHGWLRRLWAAAAPPDSTTAVGDQVQPHRALPVLGICGGHQAIAIVLGGDPTAVIPREGGPTDGTLPITLTHAGRTHPLFAGFAPDALRFNFGNFDHLHAPPKCATTLACAEKSPAVACDWGRGWCTTQFHPEASSQWFSECVAGGLIAPPEIGYSPVGDDAGKALIANWLRGIVIGTPSADLWPDPWKNVFFSNEVVATFR